MNIIVCVDDNFGMLFAGRRQSRDKAVTEDIIRTIGEKKLYISQFSEILFKDFAEKTVVIKDLTELSETEDFCFAENIDVNSFSHRINKVILYKWNRRYPADLSFDKAVLCGKSPKSVYCFKGNSHDKITKEVYEL